ncbi:transposable element Tcb2 transposase [Trichonephila clavipes]|nr:transposable element Tcb2 transposase [Trichonephila clavipes]
MSFTRRPGSGLPRQTSCREDRHIRNTRVQPTASSVAIQAQVAPSLDAPVSPRTIRIRLAEGHLGSWRPLCELPLKSPPRRHLLLEWCCTRGNWTGAELNQVVFSEESRFNLICNDNQVRVWRPSGECLNPAFALLQHTAPSAVVMVWGVIAYNTRCSDFQNRSLYQWCSGEHPPGKSGFWLSTWNLQRVGTWWQSGFMPPRTMDPHDAELWRCTLLHCVILHVT